MRGNKSLRVCPTVNNEAGNIHLERSQEKHTACRNAPEMEQLLSQTLLDSRYKGWACGNELYVKRWGQEFN